MDGEEKTDHDDDVTASRIKSEYDNDDDDDGQLQDEEDDDGQEGVKEEEGAYSDNVIIILDFLSFSIILRRLQ